jgi:glutathione S-transferase
MVPLMHGFRHTHPHMSQMENQNQAYGLAQRELAVKSLDTYNNIIASREYIAGERFTYADIQMVTSLQFLVRLNKLKIEDFRNITNYISNILKRASFSI